MAPSLSGELHAKKKVYVVFLEILDSTNLFNDRDASELFKQALPSTAVTVWRCSKKNGGLMSEQTPKCLATQIVSVCWSAESCSWRTDDKLHLASQETLDHADINGSHLGAWGTRYE